MSGVYFASIDPIYSCGDCPFRDGDGYCDRFAYHVTEINKPGTECGIINVPNHGRLIDLDAFMQGCQDLGRTEVNNGYSTPEDMEIKMEFLRIFFEKINPTPTIIPADQEEKT